MKTFSTVQITSIFKIGSLAESTASYKQRLYSSLLFQSIRSLKSHYINSPLKQIANIEYNNALQVLFIVGVLDLYHDWEKNIKQFFKEENIELKKREKKDSFVDITKKTCDDALEFTIPNEIWLKIDELRQVVNAYKHGNQQSFYKLKSMFPKYFKLPRKYIIDSKTDYSLLFRITKGQFILLSKTIINFWKIINKNLQQGTSLNPPPLKLRRASEFERYAADRKG